MTNWANYGKWRHGKKRKELLENNIFTYPEDVPAEIMNPIMEDVARQVENWENINKMKIDKEKLFELYMQWVNQVLDECDWKTSFEPKEIVYAIATILENNPKLVNKNG
jgi:hypothetical protein